MTPEEFCMWLEGYMDANGNNILTTAQGTMIKRKLKEVEREPIMDFEVGGAGEMFQSDSGQMFAIWNCDTTCNLNVDQFNVDYVEK
jgi:hypothetical protein